MPPMTSQWAFDPDTVNLSEEAELACGLRFDLDPEHHRVVLVGHGTWWVLPFARTLSDEIVGVRMMPRTALAQSPVVTLNQAEAITIASTPACPRRQLRRRTRPALPGSERNPSSMMRSTSPVERHRLA
jgi:hypothetical protein